MKKLISLVLAIAMITAAFGTTAVFAAADEFFDDFSAIVRTEEKGNLVANYAGDEGVLFSSANELYYAYKHWESNNPPVSKSDGTTQGQYLEGNGATGANTTAYLLYEGAFSGQYLAFETALNDSGDYTAKQYYEAYSPKISVSADGEAWTALTPEYLDYRLIWKYIGDNSYGGRIGTFVIENLPENTNYLKVGFVGDWHKKIISVKVSDTGTSTSGMVSIDSLYSDLALYDDFSTIVTTKDGGQLNDGVNEGGKYAYADWHLFHKTYSNVSANGVVYPAYLEGWQSGWDDVTGNNIAYSGEFGGKTLALTMGYNDSASYEAMVEKLNLKIYAGASSGSLTETAYTHYSYGDTINSRVLCTFYIDELPENTTYIKFVWDGNWVVGIFKVMVTADSSIIIGSTAIDGTIVEATPTPEPTATPDPSTVRSLKVLAIGNSFSVDAMEWLYNIADDYGIENIVLGNAYIGGCSLSTHAGNAKNDSASYTYYKNTTGSWTQQSSKTMSYCIKDEDWDIITLQQVSTYSGMPDTYEPYLTNLIDYVNTNKTNPDAKLAWHTTWAYAGNSTHSGFANYNNDQLTMYNAIISTVKSNVLTKSEIAFDIPSGTAIQNVRTSFIGDNLTRDGYHLSNNLGRYIAGLTWFHKITGLPIDDITYVPSTTAIPSSYLKVIKECVKNAVSNPYEITQSKYTDENQTQEDIDLNDYNLIDWEPVGSSYYNSTLKSTRVSPENSTATNLKYFISSKMFTKADLPNGTIIEIDEGYQYRPEGWITLTTTNSSSKRPANITLKRTVVDDSWWGDFNYRAFNISAVGSTTDLSKKVDEVSAYFRIYVPKNVPSATATPTPTPSPTPDPSIVIYDKFDGSVTRDETNNLRSSSGSITTNSSINGGSFAVTYLRRPDGGTMNNEASVVYDVSPYNMDTTTLEMGAFYLYSPTWGVPSGTTISNAEEHLDKVLEISTLEIYESSDGATYTPVTATLSKYPGPNPGQSYHYVIYNAPKFNADTQFVKIVLPSLTEARENGIDIYGWDPGLNYVKFVDQSRANMKIVTVTDEMNDSTMVYERSGNITYAERSCVTSSDLYPEHQDLNNPYKSYMANREWAATQNEEAYFIYEIEDADKTSMTVDTFFYNSGLSLDDKLSYSQLKIYESSDGLNYTEKTDVKINKIPGPWAGQSFHYVGYTAKNFSADTAYVKILMPDISEAKADGVDIAGWEPYIDKVTFTTTYGEEVETTTKLSLPNVYMNNMVLQAGSPVIITGTAAVGRTVTATLSDGSNTYTATGVADNEEKFSLTFDEVFKPSYTAYTLSVTDGERTRAFADVVFGDVYLTIGQSNMEMNVWDNYYGEVAKRPEVAPDIKNDIDNATDNYLRVMRVSTESYANPSDNLAINYRWKNVTSENVWSMTAIGFHFGRVIRQQQDYPIGIIDAAWGGTAIEPWLVGGTIYNSHVHPLRNMGIKGIMWYQGESNSSYPDGYAEKNIELVDTYREIFGESTPFGIVQLANFENDADFRLLREEQLDTFRHYEAIAEAEGTQNTFTMLSIIEHVPGDKKNIHPEGKKDVALKFVTWANAVIYGTETEYTGPVPLQALKVDGGIEVTYTHYGNSLTLREGAENVGAFKVYSTATNYEYAYGTITGDNKVLVETDIENPLYIAYATDVFNTEASLMNDKGFGCTAFQPIEVVSSAISDVTVADGKVTKVSMVNENAQPGNIIVAVYDGNILLDINVVPVTASDYTGNYVEADVDVSTEGATKIKAMFLDGLSNIMPNVNVYKK